MLHILAIAYVGIAALYTPWVVYHFLTPPKEGTWYGEAIRVNARIARSLGAVFVLNNAASIVITFLLYLWLNPHTSHHNMMVWALAMNVGSIILNYLIIFRYQQDTDSALQA